MRIELVGGGLNRSIDIKEGATIREILLASEIHPSTVITSLGDRIIPHNTVITEDMVLELVVVSSGG